MEQDKIISEYNEIILYIADLLDILSKPERVLSIIDDDLNFLKEKFGDQRKSVIEENVEELQTEDLITPTDMVVTLSHSGYIKDNLCLSIEHNAREAKVSKQQQLRKMIGLSSCLLLIHMRRYSGFQTKAEFIGKKFGRFPRGRELQEEDRLSTIGLCIR